jgi:5-methyltetrahydropteroyltriglutamate--homocysteine methyltransferase
MNTTVLGYPRIGADRELKKATESYHYLVPELEPETRFRLAGRKPFDEYLEAKAVGIETRPVLVGPLSFLLLAKPFRPELLDPLLDAYAELLARLAEAGVREVQLDEPVLAADRTEAELTLLRRAYDRLGALTERPALLVSTYFGEIGGALPILAASQVEAIGLDFVAGPENLRALAGVGGLPGKTLVAGLVDGRNVWRTDLTKALATGASLLGLAANVSVSTSCSLLHVPLDTAAETRMDADLRDHLAFARQKVDEVVLIGRALSEGRDAVAAELAAAEAARTRFTSRADGRIRARLDALGAGATRRDHGERFTAQRSSLNLPPLATTTIGSFPADRADQEGACRASQRPDQ